MGNIAEGYICCLVILEQFFFRKFGYFHFSCLKLKGVIYIGGMLVMNYLSASFLKKCYILTVTISGRRNCLHSNTANNTNNKSNKPTKIKILDLTEPPTNCCFSGCANCVWIKYAEDLSVLFNGAEDKVKEIIISKIDDPNMKAFLSMELTSIKFKK